MTTTEEALTLGDILDDLTLIGSTVTSCAEEEGDASYESVQQRLSQDLKLHLLSYVRFLENNEFLIYNRISDSMELTPEGQAAMQNPASWEERARAAFAEHFTDDVNGESDAPTNMIDVDALGQDFMDQFDVATGAGDEESESRLADIALGIDDLMSEVSEARVSGISEDSAFDSEPSISLEVESEPPMTLEAEVDDLAVSESTNPARATIEAPFEPEPEPEPEPEAAAKPKLKSKPYTPSPPAGERKPMTNNTPSRPRATPVASPKKERPMSEQYERTEEIGSGGIGTVYRSRQVRLNRDVAVKEVREIFNVFAGVQRDDIIERFTEIIQTHACLLHPNIVQIVDIDTDGEYPFVVMQYAPNGNLRRLIEVEDRPPLGIALKYFLQILHALNAAHDKEIVHGSIKPENVVLDASGNALLTDFGISRVVERDGGKGNQVYVGVGTVAYMSPEQFQDPNQATVKSDVYSLGIMLYEMLTGKVPGRRSPMPSSFYPDIPRKLDDIFDCMSMDREEDRFDSIDDIIAELYAADEVMNILDKRSGVLFLRDPITHGALGLVNAEVADFSPIAEFANDESYSQAESEEASADDEDVELDEASSEAEADESGDEEVSEAGDESAEEAADADEDGEESEASDEEGGDVLDKLNKYGEMFEED